MFECLTRDRIRESKQLVGVACKCVQGVFDRSLSPRTRTRSGPDKSLSAAFMCITEAGVKAKQREL